MDAKKMVGKKISYRDYGGSIIPGTIIDIGFHNSDFSIVWFRVDFGDKAFLVPKRELIFAGTQLTLFEC